jgi:hypothetical protein
MTMKRLVVATVPLLKGRYERLGETRRVDFALLVAECETDICDSFEKLFV